MPTPSRFSAAGALVALFVTVDSSFARKLAVPECGTIQGRVEGQHRHGVAGLRVSVQGGGAEVSDVITRHGTFELHVPGPGTLTLVASRTASDSATIAELSPARAYTLTLDVEEPGASAVQIAGVTLTPRGCAGPPQ